MDQPTEVPSLVLLAAGSGTRMGGPKALLHYEDGTSLVARQVERMSEAAASRGFDADVLVVLGPCIAEASRLVTSPARVVENPCFGEGLSTSLRAGLQAVPHGAAGAVISLVDLPDVPAEAHGRMLDALTLGALARAHWNSVPGHPVAIGRDHFAEAIDSAHGDEGLRTMLALHEVSGIECADLLPPERSGIIDLDTPESAARRGLHLKGHDT